MTSRAGWGIIAGLCMFPVIIVVLFLGVTGGGTPAAAPATAVAAAGPAAAAAVTSASETAFISAALTDIGAPDTPANSTSMAAWYLHEYPSWPPGAQNNPWDSTLPEPGSTPFNTLQGGFHVWNYPSPTVGAHATALTLEGGPYSLIVAALRSGAGLCRNGSLAGEFSTWSGGGYSGVC
jgi:hypothetical protein